MNIKESVLVIRSQSLKAAGYFEGFTPEPGRYLYLLQERTSGYMDRAAMERDEEYKQIVIYVLVVQRGRVWCYLRGPGQGEERLHGHWSLGVGGHVNLEDRRQFNLNMAAHPEQVHTWEDKQNIGTLIVAATRETAEELDVSGDSHFRVIGLINDDSNPVGRVHLGVVFMMDADRCSVKAKENHMLKAGFFNLFEIARNRADFETWSQILIDAPLGGLLAHLPGLGLELVQGESFKVPQAFPGTGRTRLDIVPGD